MSNTVGEVYDVINGFAPFDTQVGYDNAGLCVGCRDTVVSRVLVCLDITPSTVTEAVRVGAQLIVSHHPVIWDALKRLPSDSVVYLLARHNLSAVCAHTNWDQADGGVNDILLDILGAGAEKRTVVGDDGSRFVRIGKTSEEYNLLTYAEICKKKLSSPWVQVVDSGLPVRTVAVVGGAGGSEIALCAASGADTVVTGEAKHHEMLFAEQAGINLICAGHFDTEVPSMKVLCERLSLALPQTEFVLSTVKPSFKGV